MSDTSPEGTFGDWMVNAAARTLIGLALLIPYRQRVAFFGWLMARVVSPLLGYEQRCLTNLSYVWPHLSEKESKDIAEGSAQTVGRFLIELYSGRKFLQRAATDPVVGPGLAALDKARSEGRPVILMTGHLGNCQSARATLNARGYGVGGLYRTMANSYFNAHYERKLAAIGEPIYNQERTGMKELVRHMKAGGISMWLSDLYVGQGVEIPFLGKPAWTATTAAEVALKYNAAVIPFHGIRQPDGISFEVFLDEEIPHSDPVTMTQAYHSSLERQIEAHPGQWFWIHRRWKRRADQPPRDGVEHAAEARTAKSIFSGD